MSPLGNIGDVLAVRTEGQRQEAFVAVEFGPLAAVDYRTPFLTAAGQIDAATSIVAEEAVPRRRCDRSDLVVFGPRLTVDNGPPLPARSGHVGRVRTVGTEGLPSASAVQRYFVVLGTFAAIDHGHELAVLALTPTGDICHLPTVGADHGLADLLVLRPRHTIGNHRCAGLGLDDADVSHLAAAGPEKQGSEVDLIVRGRILVRLLAAPCHRAPGGESRGLGHKAWWTPARRTCHTPAPRDRPPGHAICHSYGRHRPYAFHPD